MSNLDKLPDILDFIQVSMEEFNSAYVARSSFDARVAEVESLKIISYSRQDAVNRMAEKNLELLDQLDALRRDHAQLQRSAQATIEGLEAKVKELTEVIKIACDSLDYSGEADRLSIDWFDQSGKVFHALRLAIYPEKILP